jgi:hypothetical protein
VAGFFIILVYYALIQLHWVLNPISDDVLTFENYGLLFLRLPVVDILNPLILLAACLLINKNLTE